MRNDYTAGRSLQGFNRNSPGCNPEGKYDEVTPTLKGLNYLGRATNYLFYTKCIANIKLVHPTMRRSLQLLFMAGLQLGEVYNFAAFSMKFVTSIYG